MTVGYQSFYGLRHAKPHFSIFVSKWQCVLETYEHRYIKRGSLCFYLRYDFALEAPMALHFSVSSSQCDYLICGFCMTLLSFSSSFLIFNRHLQASSNLAVAALVLVSAP